MSRRIITIIVAGGLMVSPVFASQITLDLSELVDLSEVIVTGQVLAEIPFVQDDHQVETEVQVQVEEVFLSNDAVDEYIRIIYPGGNIPDYQYSVFITDTPTLEVGERYFLFLTLESADNYHLVSPQGAIKISKEVVSYKGSLISDFQEILKKYIDQKITNSQNMEY